MKYSVPTVLAALLLAGCTGMASLRTDTAIMPNNPEGGPAMNQTEAIALASWALKSPANTAGNPERAARAIAAEDWLAGQTQLTGEFGTYAPVNEVSWYELRREARSAIGVAPNAPSQVVVDQLLAAADALKAGHDPAPALTSPVFSHGPTETLAALSNLPPLPGRDRAFYELDRNDNFSPGDCRFPSAC
jgi:hypothetical protein